MKIRKIGLAVILAAIGQGVVISIAWCARKQGRTSEQLLMTILWAGLFAGLAGVVVGLLDSALSTGKRWSRTLSVLAAAALAILGYVMAFLATVGMIRNLTFPLLLIFLAGSVFAFVSLFWRGRLVSGAVSLAMILAIGFSSTALFWVTERRNHMYITVVRLVPRETTELKILPMPGIEIGQFDRETLSSLGLRGEAWVTNTFSLGPKDGPPSHAIIILTHLPSQSVSLHEPKTNITYVQDESVWKQIPTDARLSWRKIELYPIQGNCAFVSVWQHLGQHTGTGGPCWN
jgi:hypothetical protein